MCSILTAPKHKEISRYSLNDAPQIWSSTQKDKTALTSSKLYEELFLASYIVDSQRKERPKKGKVWSFITPVPTMGFEVKCILCVSSSQVGICSVCEVTSGLVVEMQHSVA